MLYRVLLVVWLTATLAAFAALPAHAEEQMSWRVDSYDSDIPDGADTVVLTYGVPETDAVAFEATCGGRDGLPPHAVFWYDTIDLAEGEDVVLKLSVGDFEDDVPAKVHGKYDEVGVSGLQAVLSASAPVWRAMASDSTLTYGISDGESQTLHLHGGARAIQSFTAACKAIDQDASEARDTESPESTFTDEQTSDSLIRDRNAERTGSAIAASIEALASTDLASTERSQDEPPAGDPDSPSGKAVSCEAFGTLKSIDSETPMEVTFVNKSDGYRGLVWIDTEGTAIDNTGLNQGESVTIPTFAAHVWMITDGPGNCIEMFVPEAGDTTFEITAPAPILGPDAD